MPTRYLKPGVCDSDAMERIRLPASEVFYYRLLTVVDDFGRMDARPLLLKARCFPIKASATEKSVSTWLDDLNDATVIQMYTVAGKRYLQITKWDNKPRSLESKFPSPADADNCIQTPESREQLHTVLPVTVTVTGTETVTKTGTETSGKPDINPLPKEKLNGNKAACMEVLDFLNLKAGRHYRPDGTNLQFIAARLKEGASVVDCRQVIAKKTREWKDDPKMSEYLRPATLFNREKFSQYVGELGRPEDANAVP